MKQQEIQDGMLKVQGDMVAQTHTRNGLVALYDAACWSNDGKEAGSLREKIHNLLDSELDARQQMMLLSRKMMELPKQS